MDVQPPQAWGEAETYRSRARLLDRAARVYEQSANLHEYFASRCGPSDFAVEAQGHADRAREAAERSRSRRDHLYAVAAAHDG